MGSNTFDANGTWTVPATVGTATQVTIEVWAAGGGGGGGINTNNCGGGGGGGGAYVRRVVSGLITGNTHAIVIGTGGTGGTGDNGTNGTVSTCNNNVSGNTSTIIGANGGVFGLVGVAGGGAGGDGGAANADAGMTSYRGGYGYNGNATANVGGGAGAAAGNANNGANATSQTGATGANTGGGGGAGGSRNANGVNGTAPGGGGGGGGRNNATSRRGGYGAVGKVIITWADNTTLVVADGAHALTDDGGGTTQYFGVCNSDGTAVTTDGNESDTACINYNDDSVTCPGSGNKNIQDLSVRCYPTGSCNIRLGVYSSDGSTLIAEGTGEVALSGIAYAWFGHMSQSAVKAAGGSSPGVIVGGTSYRLCWTQDGVREAAYQDGYEGMHSQYIAGDYTAGMPANTEMCTDIWNTGRHHIRCGVSSGGIVLDQQSAGGGDLSVRMSECGPADLEISMVEVVGSQVRFG